MFAQAGQAVRPESKPAARTIVVTRHCPREMYRSNWRLDQFVLAKPLGGGYASTVHLAICKATGTQVAIKVYHRCKLSELNNYQVHREIRIHSCLDHKNVLQLFAAFEDEVGVYLVTEYASCGDVFGELDRRGGIMTEGDAVRQVLAPFLSALQYLHALNIIHRDIKPENLLFTAAGVLKVADFGLSIDITQERPVTRVGTLDYMAPEVVICPDKCFPNDNKEKKHLHYTHLVDAWAVGVLAYELTVGRAPFDAGEKRRTIKNILYRHPCFPEWISDGARHFVNFSLTKAVARRPGIQQLAEHPWIHLHAGVPRPNPLNAGRAVSWHNLSLYCDPSKAATAAQPRHRLMEEATCRQQEKLGNLQEEEEEDEVFVSATGEGISTAAEVATAAGVRGPIPQRAAPAVSPVAVTAQAGSTVVTTLPPVNTSPFAAAQPTPSVPPSNILRGLPVLGAAADKLRAFVHRCQSANDLESLKAFMLQQPAEPSNACFEPGGRFYTGSPGTAGAGAVPAATSSANAAALGCPRPTHAHDSAASLGSSCSSSSSSSRPVDLPRGPSSNTSILMSPRPLQVVKLPASMCQQMPKSDSCRSLQGLALIAEGKTEGKVSSLGGVPILMPPNSNNGGLAGTGPGSLMPASPAAAVLDRRDTQDHTGSPSTSSCSCSYSSSCESGLQNSSGSISSSHSWGYQQQQQQPGVEQYQAPQPPSPPCKLSRDVQNPFSPAVATHPHLCYGGSRQQQQHSTTPAGATTSLNPDPSGHRTPSCKELEQLITMCKPGHAVPVNGGTAHLAGKRTLVSISADCRPLSPQQQQLVGPGEMLVQGPMDQTNGCFAFLKSPRR